MAAPPPGLDLFSGIGGLTSGAGGAVISVITFLFGPLVVMFIGLTLAILYLLFIRRMAITYPWEWIYRVSLIYPFADDSIAVFADQGAGCVEDGLPRFAVRNDKTITARPDSSNVYPNNEVVLVSLSRFKKMFAWRDFDRVNHRILIRTEDPNVSQMYFAESVEKRDPDYLLNQISNMTLMLCMWVVCGLMLFMSSLIVIYPIYLKLFR